MTTADDILKSQSSPSVIFLNCQNADELVLMLIKVTKRQRSARVQSNDITGTKKKIITSLGYSPATQRWQV